MIMPGLLRRCTLLAALFSLPLLMPVVADAAPQVNNVSQRGLQIGEPTTLIFDGAELFPEARIVSNVPIKSQQVAANANASRVAIEMVVDESAQPGVYAVRLASGSGVSNPVLIAVDRLPQAAHSPQVDAIPIALSGNLGGAEVKRTTFTGRKDQEIMLDVEAQRLGANFKPVLRLFDNEERQLAFATSQPWHGGDARVSVRLPADGPYTVELHDRLYRAGSPGMFRLKIGEFQTADRIHPAAVAAGSSEKLSLLGGNVPSDAKAEVASVELLPGNHPAPWPQLGAPSGPSPNLIVSSHREVVQGPDAAVPQDVGVPPLGISGVLSEKEEEDRYLLTVMPNQRLQFVLQARSIGSPVDGVLAIRNEQGGQFAAADDVPGSLDPVIDFTVPAGTTKIVIAVKDLLGRGGSEFNYRVLIRDLGQPDFTLSLSSDRILIPSGGTQAVEVEVSRTSYNGPIQLEFPGLPSEIEVQGAEIPTGSTLGLITFTAPQGINSAGVFRIVGRAAADQVELVRVARAPEFPGSRLAAYLRDDIAFGIATASPISVAWSPTSDSLLQGVSLPAKATIARAEGIMGPVRLRLRSTQSPVMKTIKENNQDKQVVDLARTLRLESEVVLAADQNEAEVAIFVPGDLAPLPRHVALVAELLSPDGMNVVATAFAPSHRFEVQQPFALELTSSDSAEGKAGLGEAGKFTGKVRRAAGFNQALVVTLSGLPEGYRFSPVVQVPGDREEFELPLNFLFGSAAAELKNVQLEAALDPHDPTAARSNAVAVHVNLIAGEKPAAEQPLEIFNDDEQFVARLTEGGGAATADPERHSGSIALRVTPDRKENARLPGIEAKIRQNPGPGEYRYLRFAWKKKQGDSISLQLAHDGQFGPGDSQRPGAKFRYHAGPGEVPFGPSVLVDEKLPSDYVVVVRDLFADFGEFTLTGFSFGAVSGEAAYFDGIYLGRTPSDFELIP
jgi:hypothetical protein